METATFMLAALGLCAAAGLLLALVALGSASKARAEAQGLRDELARRAGNAAREQEEKLEILRRQVADLVSGRALRREMVLEGRLWGDMAAPEAVALHSAGMARFLDVRTRGETALGIVAGAQLIPVEELEQRWREVPRDGKQLVVYCASGGRSAAACEFLASKGLDNLANLDAGFSGWNGPRAKP